MQHAAVQSWRCFEAIVWLAHLLRRKMSPVWPSRSSLNLLGGDQELWSSDSKFYKIVGIDRTTEVQSYASIPTIFSPRGTQHRYPPEIDLPRLAGRAAWIPQWRHQHRAWCIYRQVLSLDAIADAGEERDKKVRTKMKYTDRIMGHIIQWAM